MYFIGHAAFARIRLMMIIGSKGTKTRHTSQLLFFVRQQEEDRDGHAHVPGTVRVRIVGLGLGKCKDTHSYDGQNDARSEPEYTTSWWITVLRATTHSHLHRQTHITDQCLAASSGTTQKALVQVTFSRLSRQ